MQTIIGNCTVTIEDGNCYVERDGFSASISALAETACLSDNDGGELRIASKTIDQIVAYAQKHLDAQPG